MIFILVPVSYKDLTHRKILCDPAELEPASYGNKINKHMQNFVRPLPDG